MKLIVLLVLIVLSDSVNAAADWFGDAVVDVLYWIGGAAVFLPNFVGDISSDDWVLALRAVGAVTLPVALATFVYREILVDRRRQEDEMGILRSMLSNYRSICSQLDQMVSHDMTREVVSALVHFPDPDLRQMLKDLHRKCFQGRRRGNLEKLKQFLKANRRKIGMPIHTTQLESIDGKLERLEADAAHYRHRYPSLYRVLQSAQEVIKHVVDETRTWARDEETWTEIILKLYDKKRAVKQDVFKAELSQALLDDLNNNQEKNQENINDILEILTITVRAYVALDDKRLFDLSDDEKKKGLKPITRPDYVEALTEAKRCVKTVFAKTQMNCTHKVKERDTDRLLQTVQTAGHAH